MKKPGCIFHYPKKKSTERLWACLRYQQLPFVNSDCCALVILSDAQMMELSVRLEQRWAPGTYLNSPLIISLTPYKPYWWQINRISVWSLSFKMQTPFTNAWPMEQLEMFSQLLVDSSQIDQVSRWDSTSFWVYKHGMGLKTLHTHVQTIHLPQK